VKTIERTMDLFTFERRIMKITSTELAELIDEIRYAFYEGEDTITDFVE
jgi:hypothetical protein